ncbi:hypothetical protein PUN28_011211 [Cardiocondyla obscurior]|uniref:Uncharacterized protein n=1 Tax=Cardiocondyla obscurior TaxID=286306 RepID=A0AAW2FLD8_9HYME
MSRHPCVVARFSCRIREFETVGSVVDYLASIQCAEGLDTCYLRGGAGPGRVSCPSGATQGSRGTPL